MAHPAPEFGNPRPPATTTTHERSSGITYEQSSSRSSNNCRTRRRRSNAVLTTMMRDALILSKIVVVVYLVLVMSSSTMMIFSFSSPLILFVNSSSITTVLSAKTKRGGRINTAQEDDILLGTRTSPASSSFLRRGGVNDELGHNTTIISNNNIRRSSSTTIRKTLERQEEEEGVRHFTYLDSEGIYNRIHSLANDYPNFVTLTSSQTSFNLPRAGTLSSDCPFEEDVVGCSNWIVTIEDKLRTNSSSSTNDELPEVLFSGCLHGNERIGPTTVVETASLLVEVAACEASMQSSSQLYKSTGRDVIYPPCVHTLWQRWGIPVTDTTTRRWVSRLVSTRRIVVVPTANALGYFRNQREEDGIDPNRDFPYDLKDPMNSFGFNNDEYTKCMQTIAGRTLNELFRTHIFHQSFTFHAGIEMIGYEWGAPSHINDRVSPDYRAEDLLSSRYSTYGGSFDDNDSSSSVSSSPFGTASGDVYKYGTMNELVYPVRGGMEDWAYAGSWDTQLTQPCRPNTYDSYSEEKTTYDNGTLRTLNMLVETSNLKTPSEQSLGTTQNLITSLDYDHTSGNGHVSRNIRLAILLIEMVQPYIQLVSVNNKPLSDDIVPATTLYNTFDECTASKNTKRTIVVTPPPSSTSITTNGKDNSDVEVNENDVGKHDGSNSDWSIPIDWTVGGALEVDETSLIYGTFADIKRVLPDTFCNVPPTHEQWERVLQAIQEPNSSIQYVTTQAGTPTKWYNMTTITTTSTSSNEDDTTDATNNTYHATIDLSSIMTMIQQQEQQQQPSETSGGSSGSSSNTITTAIKKRPDDDDNDGNNRERRLLENESTVSRNNDDDDHKIVAFVVAIVDSSWSDAPDGGSNMLPPQSHMVNARTNPSWYYEQSSSQKVIRGRYVWFSLPITIEMAISPKATRTGLTKKDEGDDQKDNIEETEMNEQEEGAVLPAPAVSATTTTTGETANTNFDPIEGPNLLLVDDIPSSSSSASFMGRVPTSSFVLTFVLSAFVVVWCSLS